MESSREARRRRILERGSDRLALITGRIQTLPSPSSSPASSPRPSDQDPRYPLPSPSSVPPHGKDSFRPTLSKSDSSTETGHMNAYNGGSGVEPHLRHPDTSNEASKAPALGLNETSEAPALGLDETSEAPALGLDETSKAPALETNHIKESPVGSSTIQTSSVSTADTHQHSAVAASESTRILCSVAAALLVVLSNLGFPGLGSNIIKSITATRPLYLLLLANLTVVLARLLSDKQGGSNRAGKVVNKAPLESGNGWADQVSRALEASLLLQKVVDSVFMDCSFYAIVVICGLCLGNLFSF
ncbi:hypothetical protein AAG906_007731 [Vitis piasezkii]